MSAAEHPSALAVFGRFLGHGCRAFGGPFVQIETLHHELVERAGWVDPDRFRRALAVYQALPGPEATEMCIWLGTTVRGRLGGLMAGLGLVGATALQMGTTHATRFGGPGLCVVALVALVLARWRSPWSVPVVMLASAGLGWLLPAA